MVVQSNTLPDSLHMYADGVIRVGNTRVTLETLAASFAAGATAEQIAVDFPGLELADIYSTIGYILRNRTAVLDYIRTGDENAAAFRAENPDLYPTGIRDRLLAKQQSMKAS